MALLTHVNNVLPQVVVVLWVDFCVPLVFSVWKVSLCAVALTSFQKRVSSVSLVCLAFAHLRLVDVAVLARRSQIRIQSRSFQSFRVSV